MLKDIVDETSHGKYDFMYLRIGKTTRSGIRHKVLTLASTPDFANNCKLVGSYYFIYWYHAYMSHPSVGYAFINFEDVRLLSIQLSTYG